MGAALFYKMTTKVIHIFILCVVCALCACEGEVSKQGKDGVTTEEWTGAYTEQLVYEGLLPISGKYIQEQTGMEQPTEVDMRKGKMYMCDYTVSKVLTTNYEVVHRDYSPWRLPTRKEANIINTLHIGTGDDRYICIDEDTQEYYTYKLSGGSVTKAGSKTKYNIRPVRTEYTSDSIIIYL